MRSEARTRKSFLNLILAAGVLLFALANVRTASAEDAPPSSKRILVLGGTGKIGRAVVEDYAKQGNAITVVGRRTLEQLDHPTRELLKTSKVSYVTMDIEKASNSDLRKIFEKHDVTIDAAEDYPMTQQAAGATLKRAERTYSSAMDAGYTVKGGKVWVRIGSPPAEVARHDAVPHRSGTFEENIHPGESHEIRNNQDHPYFASKLSTARYVQDISSENHPPERRFNARTAAPTYFIGAGSWGPKRETVIMYHDAIKQNGVNSDVQAFTKMADSWVSLWTMGTVRNAWQRTAQAGRWWEYADNMQVDSVDAKTAAKGIRMVAELGHAGETYQLPGRPMGTAALLRTGLKHAGLADHQLPQSVTPTAIEHAMAPHFKQAMASAVGQDPATIDLALRLPKAMGAQRSVAKMQTLNAAAQKRGLTGSDWHYERPTEHQINEAQREQVNYLKSSGAINTRRPTPSSSTSSSYGSSRRYY